MTYRAAPITQRDGHELENSNCRMGSGCTGLEYQSEMLHGSSGRIKTKAGHLRDLSGDPSGGTTSADIARAFASYGEDLVIRDGYTWDDAIRDLEAGSLVMLDVWAAAVGGPCLSGSGAYGHTIAVAPEKNSNGKWYVSDPWCKPAEYKWWEPSRLRAGAEEWADRCGYESARTGGPRDIRELSHPALLAIIRRFMTKYHPGNPAPAYGYIPSDTGGAAPICYTRTVRGGGSTDMAIQAPDSLKSQYRARVPIGTAFFRDSARTDKLGELSSDHTNDTDTPGTVGYAGRVIDASSRAIIIVTRTAYPEGHDSDSTIVYVADSKVELEDA